MYDIKWIRENSDVFNEGMKARSFDIDASELLSLDDARREHIAKLQDAQTRRNAASKEIGQAMGAGDTERAESLKAEVSEIKAFIQNGEEEERKLVSALNDALSAIPNIPLEDVPVGADEAGNVLYRTHGETPDMGNDPKEHFDIGEALGSMDFEGAAALSGSRFVLLKRGIARLERALGQFMLDVHTHDHGYTALRHSRRVSGQRPALQDAIRAACCVSISFRRLNLYQSPNRMTRSTNLSACWTVPKASSRNSVFISAR